MTISEAYNVKCNTPSDIYRLLPFIKKYAGECEHFTEMGVRDPTSTYAILDSGAKTVVSYDLVRHPNVDAVFTQAAAEGKDWSFIEANVLDVEIEETDGLFIDTFHTYTQLKAELAKHAGKVKKYLLFHDTFTFATKGEDSYEAVAGLGTNCGRGLWAAIQEFLDENPAWKIEFKTDDNNGLTVLRKHTT